MRFAAVKASVGIDEVLKKSDGGYLLDIEVKPRSKDRGIKGFDPWRKRFVVHVGSPAQKGTANKEVMEVVAKELGAASVEISSGKTSHSKTVAFCPGEKGIGHIKKVLIDLMEQ